MSLNIIVNVPKYSEIISKYADTDKIIWHSYGVIYDLLFKDLYKKNVDFLEIGIYSGASTKSYEEFFGPESRIVAIDTDITKIRHNFGSNVLIKQMDAYDNKTIEFLGSSGRQFDIILDDSLHDLRSHDFILTNYISLLKPNGMIILEDITYPEVEMMDLCKNHSATYMKNQHNLSYPRESNQRDYDASSIIVKVK
jgi:predicted O-methyltransferase YrrM